MKPCLKYPVTIIVLLLIGYTQLFAQVNRGIASTEIGKSRTVVSQRGGLIPANSVDIIFQETAMEEEEDRISTDVPPVTPAAFSLLKVFPVSHRPAEYRHPTTWLTDLRPSTPGYCSGPSVFEAAGKSNSTHHVVQSY